MKKRDWILFATVAIVLALPGISILGQSVSASSPAAVDVKIDNFSFLPPTITVKAGTRITWTNADDIPHNVVSNDQSFKSKVLDTDEKFTYTISKPGTYIYYCSIHPKMTGKIVVE
ncbi:MAG TPA: cupredoxin family copper-binding protein [Terriglobales bacterium]|jgi:plastocyanin